MFKITPFYLTYYLVNIWRSARAYDSDGVCVCGGGGVGGGVGRWGGGGGGQGAFAMSN